MKIEHPEIPRGCYCYTGVGWDSERNVYEIKVCPYWSKDNSKPEQENGFCSLLGYGDWEAEGLSLLWDMCKECGINDSEEDYE